MSRLWLLSAIFSALLAAHAPPTPLASTPLQVRGSALLGSDGRNAELAGVMLPEIKNATAIDGLVFRILRQRWNVNLVRLRISTDAWKQFGENYFVGVRETIENANKVGLIVVLALRDSGGLPTQATADFWRTWADRFKGNDKIIFDVFDKPSAAGIPGFSPAGRRRIDWETWRSGMDLAVTAIRSTGARQVVAVQAFDDAFLFEDFQQGDTLGDANVIYEVHARVDRVRTPAEVERKYGFLTPRFHVYAGEWGVPSSSDSAACRTLPQDPAALNAILNDQLRYFLNRGMSWTAASFEPGSLIIDTATYANTTLPRSWTCEPDPARGIGETVLLWMTGDPTGFGELRADAIANAATFLTGPIAPGEILSIYGLEIGPFPGVQSSLNASGRIPTSVGGVEVRFDGIAAPLFFASAFQANVQVPYALEAHKTTRVQLLYNGVPSSAIELPVAEASPGVFADFSREASALNQNGSLNTSSNPAAPGSIVVLFANGAGRLSAARADGAPAVGALSIPLLPVSVRVGSTTAEVLYAGEAPGLAGVMQLNVRLPDTARTERAVTRRVELTVGPHTDLSGVTVWVR